MSKSPSAVMPVQRAGSGHDTAKLVFARLPRDLVAVLPLDMDLREEAIITGLLDAQIVPAHAWVGSVHYPSRHRSLQTVRLRLKPSTLAAITALQDRLLVTRNAVLLEALHHAVRNPVCIAHDPDYAARFAVSGRPNVAATKFA